MRHGEGRHGPAFPYLDYTAVGAIAIDLSNTGASGDAALGDTFAGIEWVFGSAFGDTIRGNELANCLEGRGGHDMLYGAEGNDMLQAAPAATTTSRSSLTGQRT